MNLSKNLNELHVVIVHNFAILEHKHNKGGGMGSVENVTLFPFMQKLHCMPC